MEQASHANPLELVSSASFAVCSPFCQEGKFWKYGVLHAGWRRLLGLGVCDPEDFLQVKLNSSDPRGELTHRAIGAGGDEWELAGNVNAVIEGPGAGEYTRDGAGPEENVPSRSQTPQDRSLMRQPRLLRDLKA